MEAAVTAATIAPSEATPAESTERCEPGEPRRGASPPAAAGAATMPERLASDCASPKVGAEEGREKAPELPSEAIAHVPTNPKRERLIICKTVY